MLRLMGWRMVGSFTDVRKCILIFAYHTSNWDFPISLAVKLALNAQVSWIAKDSLFWWPFGVVLKKLGGIAVNRSLSMDLVNQVVGEFQRKEYFVLGLAPEGTRQKVSRWKTGFYFIALKAKVPIQPIAFDYANRSFVFGPLLHPSGDFHQDMEELKRFFRPFEPRHPEMADKDFATDPPLG